MNKKYKIVVNHDLTDEIDYEFLEKNNACVEAKIAFVRKYGNSKIPVSQVIDYLVSHVRLYKDWGSWETWLREKIGTYCYLDSEEYKERYVHIKDCDGWKIYILAQKSNTVLSNGLYKLYKCRDNFSFVSLHDSVSHYRSEDCKSLSHFLDRTLYFSGDDIVIYEFKTLKDFVEWYNNKEESK